MAGGDEGDQWFQVGGERAVTLGERDELPDHPVRAAGAEAELTGGSPGQAGPLPQVDGLRRDDELDRRHPGAQLDHVGQAARRQRAIVARSSIPSPLTELASS